MMNPLIFSSSAPFLNTDSETQFYFAYFCHHCTKKGVIYMEKDKAQRLLCPSCICFSSECPDFFLLLHYSCLQFAYCLPIWWETSRCALSSLPIYILYFKTDHNLPWALGFGTECQIQNRKVRFLIAWVNKTFLWNMLLYKTLMKYQKVFLHFPIPTLTKMVTTEFPTLIPPLGQLKARQWPATIPLESPCIFCYFTRGE